MHLKQEKFERNIRIFNLDGHEHEITSSNHIHHWCLNFEEAKLIEELSDVRNDLSANIEYVADSVVEDQIEITHSEPSLLVFQTEMEMRQHVKTR